MSKNYDKYLEELHKKNQTPDEIIREIIREATGKEIIEKQRIIAGEANEVYRIVTAGRLVVFLRIARKEKPEFEQEVWAINQAKIIGLPVPGVLLVKHVNIDNKWTSFCVQIELPGQVMERGSFDYHQLSKTTLRKIMNQAGLLLGKIHSIKTNGFGDLDGDGKGKYENLKQFWPINAKHEKEYLDLAKNIHFPADKMIKIFKNIRKKVGELPDNTTPILNHGDYGLKHLMYDGKNICGILDWGEVSGNSPIYDLVRWDYWFGDQIPTEWLIEGYQYKDAISGYEDNLRWLRLEVGLGVLWRYVEQNYQEAADVAINKLLDDIKHYE